MRAGQLRRRVILQQVQRVGDGAGGWTESWQPVATVWAAVEPLEGRELYAAQQVDSRLTVRVRCRWRSGVVPQMRVVEGPHVWVIRSVIDVEQRHRELQLMCEEVDVIA